MLHNELYPPSAHSYVKCARPMDHNPETQKRFVSANFSIKTSTTHCLADVMVPLVTAKSDHVPIHCLEMGGCDNNYAILVNQKQDNLLQSKQKNKIQSYINRYR